MCATVVSLFLAACLATPTPSADAPTFNRHVAPIMWKHCAGCHRPGEVGPFSLLTYDDVAKRADFIADISHERRMPPWRAEPGFGDFLDERRLSEADLAVLRRWADTGAPQGDPADLPQAPKFIEGWQLGEPDLVLEMPEPFAVPADGPDIYRCFVMPIPVSESRTVKAVEFRPGNRRVVHHAILYLDANHAARARDDKDPGLGYTSFGGPGVLPTGGLGGWAPGAMPHPLPDGLGKFLRKGSDLVMQIHYHPDGKATTDRSRVGIYFTRSPATTIVGGLAVLNTKLHIPAGEAHHRASGQSAPLPVDVNVLGVGPHMHLLGRQMKAVAETPTGAIIPLIWIKDWDFNWQGAYAYRKPVRLPKGSIVRVECVYDNSAANASNPNSPPRDVSWGEQTTDEMLLFTMQLTTDSMADLRQLVGMRGARLGGALAGGAEAQDLADDSTIISDKADPREALVDELLDEVLDNGFPIPAEHKQKLAIFDTDSSGSISRKEFDAIPEPIRDRIREAIREKIRAAVKSKS